MQDFIGSYYLWFKAFHVISVIAWMAGLLYLPRLFAYHANAEYSSQLGQTLKTMERRLLKGIMTPAMMASWFFGCSMLIGNPSLFEEEWMGIKFLCVVWMSILHIIFAKWRKDFEKNKNIHSSKFYKIWNEVPTFFMIIIVMMVIIKPF